MVVLLVLRDLAENRLPLGFATNRGMGEIKVASITLSSIGLAGPQFDDLTSELVLPDGRLSRLPAGLRTKLEEAWVAWRQSPSTMGGEA